MKHDLTKKVYLKEITEKDIELLRQWRNIYSKDFFSAEVISKEMQHAWYDAHKLAAATDMMWIIYEKSTNKPCGSIALYQISIPNRTADLGRILLIDEFRGRGLMEDAIDIVLNMAYNDLRLYKIRVFAYLDNLSGLGLYERTGFTGSKRPIILLEKINPNFDSKKPMQVKSYDEMSESYEGQATNVK
jgi:ribosomal-protein-alanine N-acetyltransferase